MTRRWPAALALIIGLLVGGSVQWSAAASLALTSRALTPYRTCTLTATPATTAVVADAGVRQQTPAANFGTATALHVASGNGANRRTYVFFDLAACAPVIPPTAIVRAATVRLFMSGLPPVCRTLDVFRVGSAWAETEITWNNQPFGPTINNPPAAQATASFSVGSPEGCQNRTAAAYVSVGSLATDVASFMTGGQTNFGWMIRDDIEGSSATRTVTFTAKQAGSVAQLPQLVITYVAVP